MTGLNLRKGEEFTKWAVPHMDHIYTASLYLTRNDQEAADLLQETFLRAFRFWHQFTPGTNCRAWLLKILHNSFNNRYRERLREQQHVEFDESTYDPEGNGAADNGPETLVLSHLLDGEVQRALAELPLEFREACMLVDVHELTYAEAAAACGCPVGTIRSRLSRARRQLQESLRYYARERGYGRDTYATRKDQDLAPAASDR
jgi:RNA polymerase sigma-70 factor (ECF subfamily)